MLVSCGSSPQPVMVLQLLLHAAFVASTQVNEIRRLCCPSKPQRLRAPARGCGASLAWEREGRGENGEEVVPPKVAMGPGKVSATAQRDIFALNWFCWDAPSRMPHAGGTSPSSPPIGVML